SVLTSSEHNLTLRQVADVPRHDTVTFTVESLDGGELAEDLQLKLRVPNWVAPGLSLSVNGQEQDTSEQNRGYISVPVAAGDQVTYTLPAEVRISDDTENPNWVAFTYGPVLLAAELNHNNVEATYTAGVLVRMSVADPTANSTVIVDDVQAW